MRFSAQVINIKIFWPVVTVSTKQQTLSLQGSLGCYVVAYDLDLFFEGQRFEFWPFGMIKRDYLANGDRQSKHYHCQHRKSLICSRLVLLYLTLAHFKGQGQANSCFNCEHLANGKRYDKRSYCPYIGNRLLAFDSYIYIWLWSIPKIRVKVIRNSIRKFDKTESCCISPCSCSFMLITWRRWRRYSVERCC